MAVIMNSVLYCGDLLRLKNRVAVTIIRGISKIAIRYILVYINWYTVVNEVQTNLTQGLLANSSLRQ